MGPAITCHKDKTKTCILFSGRWKYLWGNLSDKIKWNEGMVRRDCSCLRWMTHTLHLNSVLHTQVHKCTAFLEQIIIFLVATMYLITLIEAFRQDLFPVMLRKDCIGILAFYGLTCVPAPFSNPRAWRVPSCTSGLFSIEVKRTV